MASDEHDKQKQKQPTVFGFVYSAIQSSRNVLARAHKNDWKRMLNGISCPVSVKDALSRLRFNMRDMAPNYQVIMLLSMLISIGFRPWSFLTLFSIVVVWHYFINIRSRDIQFQVQQMRPEAIVITVRMQGVVLIVLSAILIFGFTSFSATFLTCVSVGAGVCVSHSVMKALDETESEEGVQNESSPSLLAEFQEYSTSTLSSFSQGAGFEKVIPSQVYEYGGKSVGVISSYFGQAIQRTGSNVSNASGGGNKGGGAV